jgi:diguanylate cyclase (GGDEF)-like protein
MSKFSALPMRVLNRWVRCCTGHELQDALDEEHYRQQILAVTSLLWLLTVIFVSVVTHLLIDMNPRGQLAAYALLLATGVSVVISMLVLRLLDNRIAAMHLLLLVYTGAFTVACVYFGGTRSPTYALLILTPVLAGIVGSVRATLFWSILVALVWTTYLLLERIGIQFDQIILPQNYNVAITISYLAMGIAVTSIIIVYAEMNKALRNNLQAANRELDYLSLHDDLTGLRNRRFYDDRLERCMARAAKQSGMLALLTFDLNEFKAINDTHGHGVGDIVLAALGRRLPERIRETDLIARLGGDEFAIIIEDVHSEEAVFGIARKLVAAVEEPIMVRMESLSVSASCGIALYPQHGSSRQALEDAADKALYTAKRAGRNRVHAI